MRASFFRQISAAEQLDLPQKRPIHRYHRPRLRRASCLDWHSVERLEEEIKGRKVRSFNLVTHQRYTPRDISYSAAFSAL